MFKNQFSKKRGQLKLSILQSCTEAILGIRPGILA
jgi:hypothetical protein